LSNYSICKSVTADALSNASADAFDNASMVVVRRRLSLGQWCK